MRTVAATFATFLAAAAACDGGRYVSVGEATAALTPAAPVTAVEASNSAGSIDLIPADDGRVHVRVEVRVAERRAEEVRRTPVVFADHVGLVEHNGVVRVTDQHRGKADADDWQLHVTVTVPGTASVRADVGVGSIEARLDAVQSAQLATGVGDIDASFARVAERIDGEVGVGELTVAVREAAPRAGGALSCKTGNVALALPPGAGGTFDLATDVGDLNIAARYPLPQTRGVTAASARGQVGEGEARYELRTNIGEIELR